jgi:prepilin-type N-terminal cleavage/methylation domain-containing protein
MTSINTHKRQLKRGDSENAESSGFTIIEVLIVLAIAGLIMLIVFEAIPALSRASRNNSRKQDVVAILQAVSQYELNNSANFPAGCGTGYPTECKTAAITSLLHYTNLTYYNATSGGSVTVHPQTAETAEVNLPAATSTNDVDVWDYERCNSSDPGTATDSGADYSDIVALYALETGGGTPDAICQQN